MGADVGAVGSQLVEGLGVEVMWGWGAVLMWGWEQAYVEWQGHRIS